MELFLAVFGQMISFYYSCFDRMVINGYLSCFHNPANVVYLFKELLGYEKITKEVLAIKTNIYHKWVDEFIFNNPIPSKWAEDERKEDYVKPYLHGMQRSKKAGVYFIFKSMEQGSTFRAINPKYQTDDPNYMIIKKKRSRFTHYYFYILDEVLGPMVMRVGSYFPFTTTYYLNGHSYIAGELEKENIVFKKDDNAFLSTANPKRLQEISDSLSPEIIRGRLNYWTNILAPRFSDKEKEVFNLKRFYSISQIEYCRNFIFKRNFPIRNIFERSCELGLLTMTANKISRIFGQRISKRLNGKLQTVLDKIEHGHHVLRAYFKHAFVKQYEKFLTLLRNEVVSNNLKDFYLKKSLDNLPAIKIKFQEITDRFAAFQAYIFNNHFDFNLISRLAKPVILGKTKIAGIQLHNQRLIRLMEALLHSGSSISEWKTKELHQYILDHYRLEEKEYTLNQLRYDIRKLQAHGIVERVGKSYRYRLTEFGKKVCLCFVLFHKKLHGPIANSLFNFKPNENIMVNSKFEKAYRRIDKEIDKLIRLMAA